MDRPFIKGLELAELFYWEAVRPILLAYFPGLIHSAARLDGGSEVLGFDTPQSRDHDWGPRLQLFVVPAACEQSSEEIRRALSHKLPCEIRGYPTHFGSSDGDAVMEETSHGPIAHKVSVCTVRSFFADYLHFDPGTELRPADWLVFPEQRLRTLASGRVFYDGLGELGPIRERLHYYPHDVWLYLLAAQWQRISQEEAFVGRCGDVGDELGSRILGARLVRDLVKLCFLMERQYAPYSKWLGTAFSGLRCAPALAPILERVLDARGWREREKYLSASYEFVAQMHNDLRIADPLPTQVSRFYDRPYQVIHAERFAEAIRAQIQDELVCALPVHLGAIDQFVDSTDVLTSPDLFSRLKLMYDA
jgi:hypothetical protein